MATGAMKEANKVPANFGQKPEFRPNLGGAGGNSSATRPGRNAGRDFPGGTSKKGGGGRK